MKFRLVTTMRDTAGELLADYPQLADEVETVYDKAYINIEKADEFMELAKLTGEIVIGKDFVATHEPFIEIYDSYRE